MIPKIITSKFIKGWLYNIVQYDKNRFYIVRSNIKGFSLKKGVIKEGLPEIPRTEEYFKTLKEAKNHLKGMEENDKG